MALASPIFIPERFLLKGIVFSEDKTSNELKPYIGTLARESTHATITASDISFLIKSPAREKAFSPEEHAVETVVQ